jgi:glutaredoxin-related protein
LLHNYPCPISNQDQDGKVLDKVEGANGPDLVSKLGKYSAESAPSVPAPTDLKSRLEKLLAFAPVMLFMKGTSEAPQCGFSNKICAILKENNIKFSSFNILSDDEVRQGLKVISNKITLINAILGIL